MTETTAPTTSTTFAADPSAFAGLEEADVGAFPEFLLQDPIWDACFPRFFDLFGELQVVLRDGASGETIGFANCVAIEWDGTKAKLPQGTHDVIQRAVAAREAGQAANTLVPIQAIVLPDHLGTGASKGLREALREVAARNGLERSITPLRPTEKARYPLAAMERYVEWTREDGEPLDPWLRIQRRFGAELLGVCEDSLVIEGTVAEWEAWTGLAFPESGEYVVEGALVPVQIDRESGRGRYSEPHVWLQHR